MFGVGYRFRRAVAGLTTGLATALILAACGQEAPQQAAVQDAPPPDAEIAAASLFDQTCMALNGDRAVCACVRTRVDEAAGAQGLGYIGAAYGDTPELAAPYEESMSQAERNEAAEAFLDAQFDCVIAADPDYSPDAMSDAMPGAAGAGAAAPPASESPLERAVAACVDAGAGPEPVCRCRADFAADALGEPGLELVRAAEAGDEDALRALAESLGEDWLASGSVVLEDARAACPA